MRIELEQNRPYGRHSHRCHTHRLALALALTLAEEIFLTFFRKANARSATTMSTTNQPTTCWFLEDEKKIALFYLCFVLLCLFYSPCVDLLSMEYLNSIDGFVLWHSNTHRRTAQSTQTCSAECHNSSFIFVIVLLLSSPPSLLLLRVYTIIVWNFEKKKSIWKKFQYFDSVCLF